MIPDSKPRPLDAAREWLAEHGVNLSAMQTNDSLGYDWGHRPVVMLADIEDVLSQAAENLATGKAGRRATLEALQLVHVMVTTLRSETDPDCPPPCRYRDKWNAVAGKLAPWKPLTRWCENLAYGKKKGVA